MQTPDIENSPLPNWQATWICSPLTGGPRSMVPAPYLRKEFTLNAPVKSAQLHITAQGLYVAEINGKRVGDQVFAPGWTEYRKRVQFQTWDVTDHLQQGENALGAILGDGWYCGHVSWQNRQTYGDKPELLAQLEVTLENGETVTICSDNTWHTNVGPLLENDLLMGEAYDARLELGDWSSPGFDDSAWMPVVTRDSKNIALVRSASPPVRAIEVVQPVEERMLHTSWEKNVGRMYDFGQNLVGRIRIRVTAPRGTHLRFRFAEILDKNGNLYTENLRTARCVEEYTCKGGGEESWEAEFTFHGFRYCEVKGIKNEHPLHVEAVVLHSDMPVTGSFSCSNDLLNKLQKNILWGQKGNFLEVPTDCPQRDERLGWTGDAQVFIRTACFNMNVQGFFHKWLQDMRDCQGTKGQIPSVIPDPRSNDAEANDAGPAWADAAIICPWTIYLCFNDKQILADHWEAMTNYMDYLSAERSKDHIRSHPDVDDWGGFGDWLALDGSGKTWGGTPKDLIGTAHYANNADICARTAALLGKTDEAAKYAELHGKIVQAFRNRFVTPNGHVASGTQTSYVLALKFGLIPEENRAEAAKQLVRDIRSRGTHLSTGFVGTPYLLDVLENNGHMDVAYELLEQETFPSWLFPVKNGATTIWERWDGWTEDKGPQSPGMNSYNHYAYGAVGAWMYATVAGLELDPEEPGYRHIIFRPRPGGSITWAEATLETPQGTAGIHWDLVDDGSKLNLKLTVPEGSHATLSLPDGWDGDASTLNAGTHEITWTKAG